MFFGNCLSWPGFGLLGALASAVINCPLRSSLGYCLFDDHGSQVVSRLCVVGLVGSVTVRELQGRGRGVMGLCRGRGVRELGERRAVYLILGDKTKMESKVWDFGIST